MAMRLSGLVTGMDTEALVGQLMDAQNLKKKKLTGAKTKLEWKKDAWKDLNKKLTAFYNGSVSKLRFPSTYNQKKATLSDDSKASIKADSGAVVGNYSMEVLDIASAQFVTSAKAKDITSTSMKLTDLGLSLDQEVEFQANGKEAVKLKVDADSTVESFLSKAKEAGINASFDTTQQKFFFSSKETGAANAFSIKTEDESSLAKLGLSNVTYEIDEDAGTVEYSYEGAPAGMAVKKAKDSHIVLNGADLFSSSSTVSANGLSISLTDTTEANKPVNFSVSNDIDAVYDTIKKALKEYNDLMKEMNEKYNADSSKGYEPLTAEEKRAMSDDEVEEWEKKIKDSLFRRDSKVEGIMSGMRSALMATTKVGDKTYALSSFGIMTSMNYREGGLLHIYGDPDDEVYSGETDKLKKALAENPEDTVTALTDIFEGLRSDLFTRMGASEYSSALTFYDDKQMDTDLDKYKKEIKEWDDKLAAMEDSYYKKFAAMETAMQKLQAQQSNLSGLFGMS